MRSFPETDIDPISLGVSWQLAGFNNPDFTAPLFSPTDTILYKIITVNTAV